MIGITLGRLQGPASLILISHAGTEYGRFRNACPCLYVLQGCAHHRSKVRVLASFLVKRRRGVTSSLKSI